MESSTRLAAKVGTEDGQTVLVCNGRVVVFRSGTHPTLSDLEAMALVALRLQPGEKVLQILQKAQDAGRTLLQTSSMVGVLPS
jgi:hypothetical protein